MGEPTKLTPGKAHVILIAGQSNASGQSLSSILKEDVDPKLYEELEAGFPNVKITVAVDGGTNMIEDFVPVTLGQGGDKTKFGMEVGLAKVLSEKYPDETFYVVKCSWSGAGLTLHLQDKCAEYIWLAKKTKAAFQSLAAQGLDPELFAVLWMQGETDSWNYDQTMDYAAKQEDYIARTAALLEDYAAPNGFAFIDAAISESYAWTLENVINAQKEICDAKNVNWYYLDTVALNLGCMRDNNDIAHYDSLDMLELGRQCGYLVDEVIRKSGYLD